MGHSKSAKRAFVRDFLQKSSGKPIGAHTSRSPAKQFRDSSLSKQHPLTRQYSDIHLYHNSQPHDSLRLPRKSHFHTSKPAQSTAPATKSDNIISCELQQNLHHTTRLEWLRPVLSTLPSTNIAISAETYHESRASMPHPETQIPMARPHPTPQKHNSPNASRNGTAQQAADLTKRSACAVKSSSTLQHLTFPHDSSLFHTNLTRRVFIRNPLQKLPPMAAP